MAPFPKASAKVGGWFFISKFWGKFFLIGAGGGWGKGVVCRGLGGDFFLGGGAVAPEGLGGGGLHCSTFFGGRGRAH